jgi:predicted DNA repair protein MutK
MPGGLAALLDDVSVIARAAASSVDDVAAATGRASSKTAGVVIDDAAVTPGYVTGFSPARELPIIAKIAKGSVKNKLLILLPGALLLSQFLPQAIVFVLMLGGCYLSYEGAEKLAEKLSGEKHGKTIDEPIEDEVAFEKERVSGAIRTDLILSAEIMAITLNEVAAETFLTRAAVLAIVGLAVTAFIYGAVALIVKLDDIGLHLMEKPDERAKRIGKIMLNAMPHILTVLSVVGTAAMLWVGGGIILHGTHELGFHTLYDASHGLEHAVQSTTGALGGVLGWATYAAASALVGLVLGTVLFFVLHKVFGLGHDKEEGAH